MPIPADRALLGLKAPSLFHGLDMPSERPKGNGIAERVIRVMQAFSELPGDIHSLKAIADHTGLDKAVVHRILATEVELRWVEQLGHGRYRLGSNAATSGMWAMARMYGHLDQHQILVDLQKNCGGMVLFYSLAPLGARRVCTDYAIGEHSFDDFGMKAVDMFTTGCLLRTGASGRALLAYVPGHLQEVALAEPIPETAGPGALSTEAVRESLPASGTGDTPSAVRNASPAGTPSRLPHSGATRHSVSSSSSSPTTTSPRTSPTTSSRCASPPASSPTPPPTSPALPRNAEGAEGADTTAPGVRTLCGNQPSAQKDRS